MNRGALRWAAGPLLLIAVLFGWPVAAIIVRGLTAEGPAPWDAFRAVNGPHLLAFTVGQAAASTVLTIVCGLPLAWLTARVRLRGQALVRALVTVPFVLPTVVVGVAFRSLLEPDGPLGSLGLGDSVWAILLAHAYFNVAVVARIVGGVWAGLDPRAEQAARVLGAGPLRAFGTATLPALIPAIASAAAVVFLYCATSFGIVLVVGGTRFHTLETAIYQQVVGAFDLRAAALLALVQVLVVIAAVGVSAMLRARAARVPGARLDRPLPMASLPAHLAALLACAALALPLYTLLDRSLRPSADGGVSWAAYRRLGEAVGGVVPVKALEMSIVTATQAALVALVFGLAAAMAIGRTGGAVSRFADAAVMLPLGVSAVTLGFGYLVVTASLPDAIRSSPAILPLVQGLVAMPLVVRVLVPAFAGIDQRQRRAAAVLGASPARVLRTVDLPLVRRPLAVAAGFAYVVTLGEFGAAGFLVKPDQMTLPVLIGRLTARPGFADAALAAACSVLLVALTLAVVAVVEGVRRPGDRVDF